MYEFVETETGWRVFWGIDPLEPNAKSREFVLREEQTSVMPALDICAKPLPTPTSIA